MKQGSPLGPFTKVNIWIYNQNDQTHFFISNSCYNLLCWGTVRSWRGFGRFGDWLFCPTRIGLKKRSNLSKRYYHLIQIWKSSDSAGSGCLMPQTRNRKTWKQLYKNTRKTWNLLLFECSHVDWCPDAGSDARSDSVTDRRTSSDRRLTSSNFGWSPTQKALKGNNSWGYSWGR